VASIGFVAHSTREGAVSLADETARWLREQGHTAVFLDAGSSSGAWGAVESPESLDLAVSLGGDGTMLRTVDIVSSCGVPVLGVNLGHLGYLTAVEPDALRDALRRFLSGDFATESRMTLDVSVTDDDGDGSHTAVHRSALNDLVLQRPPDGHTVRTEVSVNGAPFLTFAADSLIVATPTGSTAYNLSARGPIVSPRARVQILTPVAPHMLFDRSLVLDAHEEIRFVVIDERNAVLMLDGRKLGLLQKGDAVTCTAAPKPAGIVTFGQRNFHQILKAKFRLPDR
jgi:NAD+ kinase